MAEHGVPVAFDRRRQPGEGGRNGVAVPVDETTVRLDPYPFEASPVRTPVRARTIPTRDYASETALREAYYDAPVESVLFEFVA